MFQTSHKYFQMHGDDGNSSETRYFFNRSSSGCKKNDIIFLIRTMKKHGFAPKIAFLTVNLNIIWTILKNNDSLS